MTTNICGKCNSEVTEINKSTGLCKHCFVAFIKERYLDKFMKLTNCLKTLGMEDIGGYIHDIEDSVISILETIQD